MNLFPKKITYHDENEMKIEEDAQYQKEPDSGRTNCTEKYNREVNSYYPDPELFRRLIEGTSWDRRTKITSEQKITKIKDKGTDLIQPQNKQIFKKIPTLKINEQKTSIKAASKRKKFINKERENRLGHIVYEVLGHPQKRKE